MTGTMTRIAAAAAVLCGLTGLAAAPASAEPRAGHVIIAGAAGLRWTDVSAGTTPTLTRLAKGGSIGSLSVRSAPGVTCPGEGWLTLGSGTYAALKDPAEVDPSDGCAHRGPPRVRQSGDGGVVPAMRELRTLNESLRFGARPGLLGQSGLSCVAAAGPGAALAGADREGRVGQYLPSVPRDGLGEFVARCPLTIADLGALPEGAGRADAVRKLDDEVAALDHDRPDGSVLIVAGIGETSATTSRLHAVIADGPGFHGGYLWSPSTHRTPYAQLSDLAPTALSLLGAAVPEYAAGRPLNGGAGGRPDTLPGAVRELAGTDTAAVAQKQVFAWFFAGFGILWLAGLAALGWLLRRRRLGRDSPAIRWLGGAALALSAVPGATFAANLVPWWRFSVPVLALTAAVAVAAAAALAAGYAGPWRSHPAGPAAAVAAVTVLICTADALTGSTLQINSLLGYNPLVAGRFTGFGNIAAAAFGAAVMILAALLAYGRPRGQAVAIVAAIALPAVAVDGAPNWGADFGGVLTFVPAFAILALLASRSRVNVLRLALSCGAGVLVVAAIGLADWARPPEVRSHFGRFVAKVLDGTASEIVYRKLLTSIDLLLTGANPLAMAAVVVLAVLVFRPPAVLASAYRAIPALRLALVAVVVMSAIGFATNDSGVAVPIVAALVAVPAAFALCARAGRAPVRREAPDDTPVPDAAEPAKVLP